MYAPLSAPRLAALLGLLLLGACATSGAAAQGPRVADLSIQGAHDIPERELEEKIATSEPPWYRRLFPWLPFGEDPRFDPNAFQADLRRIERYYQARGYYQAQVLGSEVLGPDGRPVDPDAPLPGTVRIQVQVREGAPTVLTEVDLRGLEALPEDQRRQVLDALPLVQGRVFREEAWEQTKELLSSRLRELGYAEARVEGEVRVDVEDRQARAHLEVEPGRRYAFGRIVVARNPGAVVSAERIVEQARSAIAEGQPYSESALAEAQARVFRMGVFGAVKVNRGLPNRDTGTVPIIIDVQEAPFHSIRLGGGLGNDALRSEVRLLGEYTDRNFFGGLRRLTLSAQGGWAWVPAFIPPGQPLESNGPIFNVSANLEQPRILLRSLSAQVGAFAERDLQRGFEYTGGGGQLGLVWRPTSPFTLTGSYNLELYRQLGVASTADTQTGTTNLNIGCRPQEQLAGEPGCRVVFSYLEQVAVWDRRSDPITPRRGFYASLSLQEGGGPLGGNFNYLRAQPELRAYHSLLDGEELTLAARVRVGTLRPVGPQDRDAPILVRFFSGGATSMRGFNSRDLSPQQLQGPPGEEVQVPIGGRGLFEGTVEARYQLFSSLVLATFVDTGTVTEYEFGRVPDGPCPGTITSLDQCPTRFDVPAYLTGSGLHAAAGLGVRYLTPVGPIRLDVAYRFTSLLGVETPLRDASGQRIARVPGTNTAMPSPFAFHLSIGEAF